MTCAAFIFRQSPTVRPYIHFHQLLSSCSSTRLSSSSTAHCNSVHIRPSSIQPLMVTASYIHVRPAFSAFITVRLSLWPPPKRCPYINRSPSAPRSTTTGHSSFYSPRLAVSIFNERNNYMLTHQMAPLAYSPEQENTTH